MKIAKLFEFIFRKNLLTTIFTLFLIFLVIFSKSNMFAAQNGLTLWAKNVIPSLFPFFIATELLNYTNLPYFLGKLTNKFMRPIFNIPGEGSYAFIMGIISGYPVGAKIINKFIDDGTCTKQEAERMLAFTNNSGPLFIIGTIGIGLYGNTQIGVLLFITHIMACLTVGMFFGILSKLKPHSNKRKHSSLSSFTRHSTVDYEISDLGNILSNSINNAISTILLIGGFIVLFSIIISIINSLNLISFLEVFLNNINIPTEYLNPVITGFLELTNGVNAVSNIHTKNMAIQIVVTAFLLGFAGLSILLQIFSIASKNNLSMKPYIIGKLLQGAFASFYTYLILVNCNFLNLNIISL